MVSTPVPPILDVDRYVAYLPVTAQTDFAISFPLFGDKTDVAVFKDGVQLTVDVDYTVLSIASGASLQPVPISDAFARLTTSISSGKLEIYGSRRPRRQIQATAAYSTRDFNVVMSDLWATLREIWAQFRRAIKVPVGESEIVLPAKAVRANTYFAFDANGNPAYVGKLIAETVATLADLPAKGAGQHYYVTGRGSPGDGGGGLFVWMSGDQSANVAIDPQRGVWVPPVYDATGTSGAWMRQFDGDVRAKWWGVNGQKKSDDVGPLTDDLPTTQPALDFAQAVGKYLAFEAGRYYKFKGTLNVKHGQSSTDTQKYTALIRGNGCNIFVGNPVPALQVNPRCTMADQGTGRGAAHFDISGITFNGYFQPGQMAVLIGATGMFLDGFKRSRFDDIAFEGFNKSTIVVKFWETRHIDSYGLVSRAGTVKLAADASGSFCGDMAFYSFEAIGDGSAAILSLSAGGAGAMVRGIKMYVPQFYGAYVELAANGSSAQVGDIWMTAPQFDAPGGAGVTPFQVTASGGGKIFQVYLTDPYFVGYTVRLVWANSSGTSDLRQFRISGGGINYCTSANELINLYQIEGGSVEDMTIDHCTANYALVADGSQNVSISRNKFTNHTASGGGACIGIWNASDWYTVAYNTGGGATVLQDGGSGTHKIVTPNI